ncbi:Zinc finger RING-CH-type [Penicillium atrosanguineum]|uniref:Zinc finger RING-CH-type n=1 Tax=Penicillium atrosanguineum TaxID=1132637 RepID=A0A9W9H5L6_9EURO|nr:Zinc finger RING-CH-type [Penicillium atrosanguineum]KAJ5137108.1 Zinc finger RING-CH-type [Penicillium atrosanguineum]KAJ5302518.1 Zinc finger RING-CH-type [Penicillium atrosanguineum]
MSDDETSRPEPAQDSKFAESAESAEPADPADPSYPPRVCRICLESVLPTFQPSEFLQKPRVVYESEDSGRLLRPCQCKGSSRYVHESCLQTWRHADPRYGARNFWQCPTCGFQYRLQRLTWARWISSAGTQLLLTIAILLLTVFVLGFVADPILDLYLGPIDIDVYELEEELNTDASWIAHLVKGVASLGLLSFVRSIWMISPFWSPRSGILAGRTTGRDRARSLNWLLIVVGVGTFLWAVYKGVRSWSRRTLEKAGERVMDVPLPEDDVKTD